MKNLKRLSYLSIILCLILAACGTTRLRVPVTRPAEINLSGISTVAIGEIEGSFSKDLSEELTTALFNSGKYKVVDREHLDKILEEHSLDLSGLVDESTSAELGKLLGAAALVFGRLSRHDYKERTDIKEYQDKEGKDHKTYNRIGDANVVANLQIVDLTTGEIIAVKNIAKKLTAKKTATDKKPLKIDTKTLLKNTRLAVVKDFMKMIAPYQEYMAVKLFKDDDIPELEKGISYAKIGQWDEAIEYFQRAVKNNENRKNVKVDKAWFNLGVAYEYTYQFELAEKAVKKAYDIKSENDYLNELTNIDRRRSDYLRLMEQMQ